MWGWDLNQPMNTWNGVQLNSSGAVESLVLNNKQLTVIPNNVEGLTGLKTLDVRQNQITLFPVTLTNLDSLIYLDLSNNELYWLPSEISQLTNLNHLSLHHNNLTVLPESIGLLSKLKILKLNHNELSKLPDSIGNLSVLKTLFLQNNQLTNLPSSLLNLNLLFDLNVGSNRLNFSVIEQLAANGINFFLYAPQDTIPTYRLDSTYFVIVGGTIGNNTYTWFRNDTSLTPTVGDSAIVPLMPGNYHCQITNSSAPGLSLVSQKYYHKSGNIVMPGDADENGIVNALDVLYIGTAYGNTGPFRSMISIAWNEEPSTNWSSSTYGVNSKHQDCNGDGTVNDADFGAVTVNFDSTGTTLQMPNAPSFPFQNSGNTNQFNPTSEAGSSPYSLNTKLAADSTILINTQTFRQITLDLYIEHDSLSEVDHANGIALTYQHLQATPGVKIYTDATNSSLGNTSDLRIVEDIDTLNNKLDIGIFNVVDTSTLNGPILQIIIEELLAGKNPPSGSVFADICNVYLSASDTILPVRGQTIFLSSSVSSKNKNPSNITAMAAVSHSDCEELGDISIWTFPIDQYVYDWSNGDSTQISENVAPGFLDVSVSNSADTAYLNLEVLQPEDCSGQFETTTKLYLEGALDTVQWLLSDELRRKELLPLASPYPISGEYPEELLFLEGKQAIVDWVLLEIRATDNLSEYLDRKAALIRRSGEIVSTDGTSPVSFLPFGRDSVYLVINHRNHLPVIHGPVLTSLPLAVDFTVMNPGPIGVGVSQKQIAGRWAMLSGDVGDDRSIDGLDRYSWFTENGLYNSYLKADLNFDGQVTGADKLFWLGNNGSFSDVR